MGVPASEVSDTSTIDTRLAEINQRIDELTHQVSVLQLTVEGHQQSIAALGKPADAPPPNPLDPPDQTRIQSAVKAATTAVAPVPTESAETGYQHAMAVYKSKHYKKAAAMFRSIAVNYPGHDLADNALYWIGECHYAQKDYKGAIKAFKKVIKSYPNGSKVPDSLLKIGYAYLALKDPVNARSFLKKVVKQYPFTPAGAKAGDMLKKIQT